jgi:hypothetical protein
VARTSSRVGGAGGLEGLADLVVQLLAVGHDHEGPLPSTLRSTFCVKNTIDRLLPEPCVCQNTPSRLPLPLARLAQLHQPRDGLVHAEELVVLGRLLDQAALALLEDE